MGVRLGNWSGSDTDLRLTKIWMEVTTSDAAPSCFALQISGSGGFDEPNNALLILPTDLTITKAARTGIIRIPNKDGGIVQWGGADNRNLSMKGIVLGNYGSASQKRKAIENLIWHSSSVSWRARPLTLSIIIGGTLSETFDVVVDDYRIEQRRGMANIWDMDLTLTQYTE